MARSDVDPNQERLFMADADLREVRRMARFADLPVPLHPLLGKRRTPGEGVHPDVVPPQLPDQAITQLGKLLKQEEPLFDEITKYGDTRPDPAAIGAYALGGNKNNRRVGATEQERREISAAKRRQTQHIADRHQSELRVKTNTARLYRGALSSVQASVRDNQPLNPTAANFAAGAIEDFGICLRTRPDIVERTGYGPTLPLIIEHIGVYAADHHEALRDQPLVLRLVQIEQAKREDHWGAILDTHVAMRDRSTAHDREQEAAVEQLLASFSNGAAFEPTA